MPKQKPHFKVRCSVANSAKMAAVYADNDLFALWTRLGAKATERFANRKGDRFIVHDRELPALTGKGRADVARRLLERLADVSPISAQRDGDIWRIHFGNFTENQGFKSGNGEQTEPSDSDSDNDTSTKEEEGSGSAGAPPRANEPEKVKPPDPDVPALAVVKTRPKRAPKPIPPEADRFAGDFRAALVRVHEGFKLPTDAAFEAWRQSARLMLEADDRSIDEARSLAQWLFADRGKDAVFWRSNVLSVPKFREKYDQMQAQRKRANGGNGEAHLGSALLAWANQ